MIQTKILNEIGELKLVTANELGKIANRNYRLTPKSDDDFMSLCNSFMSTKDWALFNIVTLWIKKRKSCIDIKYILLYEKLISEYIVGWGIVDQFCYRIINPLIEKYDELYSNILNWACSENKDIRRLSLVAFIRSSGKLVVYYDFFKVINVIELLKCDNDIHVQKAIGWVLKCCYLNYPIDLIEYLTANVDNLQRLVFRYALENMSQKDKDRLMKLN